MVTGPPRRVGRPVHSTLLQIVQGPSPGLIPRGELEGVGVVAESDPVHERLSRRGVQHVIDALQSGPQPFPDDHAVRELQPVPLLGHRVEVGPVQLLDHRVEEAAQPSAGQPPELVGDLP